MGFVEEDDVALPLPLLLLLLLMVLPWAAFFFGDDATAEAEAAAAEEEEDGATAVDVFVLPPFGAGVLEVFAAGDAVVVAAAAVTVPPRFFCGGDAWSSLKSNTSSTGLFETPIAANWEATADGNAAEDEGNDGNNADKSRRGRFAMGSSSSSDDDEDDDESAAAA